MKKITKFLLGTATVISGTYLFSIAPNNRKTRLMKKLRQYDYAHRGLYDNSWQIPENSMAAFQRAVEHGYGIELDIHLTKDAQLVVFHDDNMQRMCHLDRKICDMTLDELKNVHLLNTEETIPLFKDVLELVDGQVPLIIELKVDHNNQSDLCQAADDILSNYKGDYCIESFHPAAVAWYKKNNSEVIRGQLSCRFNKSPGESHPALTAMTYLLSNFLTRPDFIAYNWADTGNLSFVLNHRLFKAMTVLWTVQKPGDMEAFKKQGHTVIFEHFQP